MRRAALVVLAVALLLIVSSPAHAAPAKITHSAWRCEQKPDGGADCQGILRGLRADDFTESKEKVLVYLYRMVRAQGMYLTNSSGTGHHGHGNRWWWRVDFSYGPEPSAWMEGRYAATVGQLRATSADVS